MHTENGVHFSFLKSEKMSRFSGVVVVLLCVAKGGHGHA